MRSSTTLDQVGVVYSLGSDWTRRLRGRGAYRHSVRHAVIATPNRLSGYNGGPLLPNWDELGLVMSCDVT
jgi:hypothetical protein